MKEKDGIKADMEREFYESYMIDRAMDSEDGAEFLDERVKLETIRTKKGVILYKLSFQNQNIVLELYDILALKRLLEDERSFELFIRVLCSNA